MSNKTQNRLRWLPWALAAALCAAAGAGTYALISRISDQALYTLLGAGGVLLVTVTVGALFVVKDVVQAYITRRLLAQDDLNDLRQMALLSKMLGQRTPSVNVRLPEQPQAQVIYPLPSPPTPTAQPAGDYLDALAGETIKIE
mgnify:CR=1 FL=1